MALFNFFIYREFFEGEVYFRCGSLNHPEVIHSAQHTVGGLLCLWAPHPTGPSATALPALTIFTPLVSYVEHKILLLWLSDTRGGCSVYSRRRGMMA